MSISEAVHEYPDLVKKHLGSVVSHLSMSRLLFAGMYLHVFAGPYD